MASRVKHKKLSMKRVFKHAKPVSYTQNNIISELMRDQEDVLAKYMGAIKPKRKKAAKK